MLPDLQKQFDELELTREQLISRLASVDSAAWVSSPRPGAWSLAEIAHHLMLCEEEVMRQIRHPEPDFARPLTLRDAAGRVMVTTVFRWGIRVKTPMRSVEPTPGASLNEIRDRWDSVRSELAAYLSELQAPDCARVVFRHPVAGRMTLGQTLRLLRDHFQHHVRQMLRTEALSVRTTNERR